MSSNTHGKERMDFMASFANIKDPGNAGVIRPIYDGQRCELTVAASTNETRTLEPAASYPVGFRLLIVAETVGGSGDVAITTIDNDAGNTTCTMAVEGDWLEVMIGYSAAATKAWKVYAQDGTALS